MQKESYNFSEFNFSSQIIRDLVSNSNEIKPFVDSFFSVESIENQINNKLFSESDRLVLHTSLCKQNKLIKLTDQSHYILI